MGRTNPKTRPPPSVNLMLPAILIVCAITAAGLSADPPRSGRRADRPNILLIYTDDQALGMTGFEGHPIIKTPNLDRLASESVHFTRCYVPTPQCAPSRACVLTGQYPHTHTVTTNGPALPGHADTFTARLKKAGYACGLVGKWHLPYKTAKEPGFGLLDYVATDVQPWTWDNCKVCVQGQETTADKFLTDWHGDRAIEFIEKFHDRPFFLWLCFRAPHAPLVYPPGTEQLYPPESIDLPETMYLEDKERPARLNGSVPVKGFKGKTEQDLRQDRSRYYAMITRVDENVGRLLDRLDQLGLRNGTVVVFASDNGWSLGDHGLYAKGPFFYDELIRGPLLVRYPRLTGPGARIDRLVGLVDLAPTFLELAGLTPPVTMQGQSLLPVIRDPQTRGHADEYFFEYDQQQQVKYPARGIVTRNYKFIHYPKATDLLYDLNRDPDEMRNVISTPQSASMVKVLRSRLQRWQEKTKDPLLNE